MMSVLIVLVVNRFQYFLKNPVTTKVGIKYNSSLAFPAVTICNFNRFRHSAFRNDTSAVEELRDVMASIYGLNEAGLNWTDPIYNTSLGLTDAEWMEFIKNASHQIEHMFMACNWKSKPINCTQYFSSVLTEMGFCYQFNSKAFAEQNGGSLHVKKTGSDHGLWLQLNVEQAEYTFSESNSAGVKVS